ncbi:uncharacterized protein [Battus philenor]|uniref:uncharacterized protein n=1 Tax=Battus philenor TaxID=42288 RepID=UPI0035D072AE
MSAMVRRVLVATLCLQALVVTLLEAAKQRVQLSDSYLPVAMQVIAHLTDQMAFEVKEEPGSKPPKTTTKPATTPKPLDVTTPYHRPGYYAPASPPKPSERINPQKQKQYDSPSPNTQHYNIPSQAQQEYGITPQNQQHSNIPAQAQQEYGIPPQNQQQSNIPSYDQQQYGIPPQNQKQSNIPPYEQQQYGIPPQNQKQSNIPPHDQQLYGIPPQSQQQYDIPQNYQQFNIPAQKPQYYIPQQSVQPFNLSQYHQTNAYTQQYKSFTQNQPNYNPLNKQYDVMTFDFPQYNPIQPQNVRTEEPLLSVHDDEVKPLLEPTPDTPHLLPPHFETDVDKISNRAKGFDVDELSEENLQYLSQNVREMIRMAHNPYDERLVDVWEDLRARPAEPSPKIKLSSSNLRLLLLYDLLSREAKRQRLSDYSGFSSDVMKTLVESSGGGARAQLSMALSKMVERHDCQHEYANNRAKEMVVELGKDESKLSSEIRYLQPLVYKY